MEIQIRSLLSYGFNFVFLVLLISQWKIPSFFSVFILFILTPLFSFIQKKLLRQSLGERLVGYEWTSYRRLYDYLFHSKLVSRPANRAISILLLSLLLISPLTKLKPVLLKLQKQESLSVYIPENSSAFQVTPFFYINAAWPTSYQEQLILPELPYQKGPPQKFIGQIKLNLVKNPELTLLLQGPQTWIENFDSENFIACLKLNLLQTVFNRSCFNLKLQFNSFFEERISEKIESISTFSVQNEHLTSEEKMNGLKILTTQNHFYWIIFLPNHSFQVISINQNHPKAEEVITQILRSARIASELRSQNQWIDLELQKVKINPELNNREYFKQLVKGQFLLVSKLSVDPKSVDAYYLLGMQAIEFYRMTSQEPKLDFLSKKAQSQIHSVSLYLKDVDPLHPKTIEFERTKDKILLPKIVK